jgi:N-glycosylase/DNA lyase
LPSWEELATIPEAALRACRLGYRAAFVAETARKLAAHPGGANTWLTELSVLPTPQARERLLTLPGVGPKVADCVLLFGFHRLEAFPIDTWIARALTELYGLGGWKTRQLQQFAEAHFGDLAGLAQQFLFAYVRQPGRVELKKTNNSVL